MTTLIKTDREGAKAYLAESNNGAILIGNVGIGKTTLVRMPRMVTATRIAMEYADKDGGLNAVRTLINNQIQYQGMKVVIDDLGREESVKNYSNALDPIAYVIESIYEINQTAEQKIKLYLTTNLSKSELEQKYGIRTVDRIWEMCDRIQINDVNLRKESPIDTL